MRMTELLGVGYLSGGRDWSWERNLSEVGGAGRREDGPAGMPSSLDRFQVKAWVLPQGLPEYALVIVTT